MCGARIDTANNLHRTFIALDMEDASGIVATINCRCLVTLVFLEWVTNVESVTCLIIACHIYAVSGRWAACQNFIDNSIQLYSFFVS